MIGQAHFLRIWDPATGAAQFTVQNGYQAGPIVIAGDSYQFLDFTVGDLASGGNADQAELAITLPGLTACSTVLDDALREGWLATLTIYQFDTITPPTAPPPGQVILVQLTGEVIGGSERFPAVVEITIGSALESLGAQVPPRRFTSALVGTPCRL